MRHRVTRRLTRLQTMHNVFKYSKIIQNGSLRWRFGCFLWLRDCVKFNKEIDKQYGVSNWRTLKHSHLCYDRNAFNVIMRCFLQIIPDWKRSFLKRRHIHVFTGSKWLFNIPFKQYQVTATNSKTPIVIMQARNARTHTHTHTNTHTHWTTRTHARNIQEQEM